jgi:hypothetical protein
MKLWIIIYHRPVHTIAMPFWSDDLNGPDVDTIITLFGSEWKGSLRDEESFGIHGPFLLPEALWNV